MEPCKTCQQDLSKLETIYAAEGDLYCSHTCGIKDFKNHYTNAEERFNYSVEEINPTDIGI